MDCKSIILIFYLVTLVLSGRDFYKILGVDKSTSKKDIKRAYRKLAMKFHPDKNPDDPEAADKFKEIGDAYETLADDDKRATYNKHGEEGVKKMGQGGGHDPFANFFGHFGFGGQEEQQREHKGSDVNVNLFVTLEELYLGSFVTITRNKPVYKESGGTRQCRCRMEMKTHATGPGSFQMTQHRVCDQCPGVKLVTEQEEIELEIEPGMVNGMQQKFTGKGEPHMEGEHGDLIFKVQTHRHDRFERQGDDLYCNVTVSLQEALNGFELNIPHLDNHLVKVKRDKITWPGATIMKKGEGMANFENRHKLGNLYITFDVKFPRGELSGEDRKSIMKIINMSSVQTVYNGL